MNKVTRKFRSHILILETARSLHTTRTWKNDRENENRVHRFKHFRSKFSSFIFIWLCVTISTSIVHKMKLVNRILSTIPHACTHIHKEWPTWFITFSMPVQGNPLTMQQLNMKCREHQWSCFFFCCLFAFNLSIQSINEYNAEAKVN